jgi:hypothetical protein
MQLSLVPSMEDPSYTTAALVTVTGCCTCLDIDRQVVLLP